MKIVMEIRPGEGGEDARLLARDQAAIYIRYAERHNLGVAVEDNGAS